MSREIAVRRPWRAWSRLRYALRVWVERIAWQKAQTTAGVRLALDLGLPADAVIGVLDRAGSDLSKLSPFDDDIDAVPVLHRAMQEITKLDGQWRSGDVANMERFVRALPERDYQILRLFKQGRKHAEIALLMETDVASVRDSLVMTYSGLRMMSD